jgi:hypothetical protein
MAVRTTGSLPRATLLYPRGSIAQRIRVRLLAGALDSRIAAGEEPSSEAALMHRSAQLVSPRLRRSLARGLERLWSERSAPGPFSAAAPVDRQAFEIARPALQQLASALRTRSSADPRGVALTAVLLTHPSSALYGPAYTEQLYEHARAALLALGPDQDAP